MVIKVGQEPFKSFKIKEVESEFVRKQIKKTMDKDDRIKMPAYLCDECEKNYWTVKVRVRKNINEAQIFQMCDQCWQLAKDVMDRHGPAHGSIYQILVARRTVDNKRDIERLLRERYG